MIARLRSSDAVLPTLKVDPDRPWPSPNRAPRARDFDLRLSVTTASSAEPAGLARSYRPVSSMTISMGGGSSSPCPLLLAPAAAAAPAGTGGFHCDRVAFTGWGNVLLVPSCFGLLLL